jgi:hypothetical protein
MAPIATAKAKPKLRRKISRRLPEGITKDNHFAPTWKKSFVIEVNNKMNGPRTTTIKRLEPNQEKTLLEEKK